MNELLLTAIITIATSSITGFVTWLLSKKKYDAAVKHDNIENMENSLEFYDKLSKSNNKILEDILARSEKLSESNLQLMIEVQNLRAQLDILIKIVNTELKDFDGTKYGIEIDDEGNLKRIKNYNEEK